MQNDNLKNETPTDANNVLDKLKTLINERGNTK
jgi:hypothetical protein